MEKEVGEDEFRNFKRDIKGQGVRFHEVCVCVRACVRACVCVCVFGLTGLIPSNQFSLCLLSIVFNILSWLRSSS